MMQIFDAEQTTTLLPWRPLAEAILAAAAARAAGTVSAPERTIFALQQDDVLLLMPASDERHACVKLVTVNHANPAQGLPRIQGEVLLIDRVSGQRLAMFDGVALTARRTAAVSLAAALALKIPAGRRLLIYGAGTQALSHAQAFHDALAPSDIAIIGRSSESAQKLVDRLAACGVPARVAENAAAASTEADLIVTATTARQPVFADRVHADARIFAVGAFTPQMCELPASLVRRSKVVVDTLAGAQAEAGDLIQAGVAWSGVIELEAAGSLAETSACPVVFKSVGSALWDLAAAALAWQQLPLAGADAASQEPDQPR